MCMFCGYMLWRVPFTAHSFMGRVHCIFFVLLNNSRKRHVCLRSLSDCTVSFRLRNWTCPKAISLYAACPRRLYYLCLCPFIHAAWTMLFLLFLIRACAEKDTALLFYSRRLPTACSPNLSSTTQNDFVTTMHGTLIMWTLLRVQIVNLKFSCQWQLNFKVHTCAYLRI